jgi:hypothetical protein
MLRILRRFLTVGVYPSKRRRFLLVELEGFPKSLMVFGVGVMSPKRTFPQAERPGPQPVFSRTCSEIAFGPCTSLERANWSTSLPSSLKDLGIR